jgi:hypothetical protein
MTAGLFHCQQTKNKTPRRFMTKPPGRQESYSRRGTTRIAACAAAQLYSNKYMAL